MTDAIAAAVASASSCSADSECASAFADTACQGTCPVPLRADALDEFQALLAALSQEYCTGYAPKCGYSTPMCIEAKAVCHQGTCDLEPSMP